MALNNEQKIALLKVSIDRKDKEFEQVKFLLDVAAKADDKSWIAELRESTQTIEKTRQSYQSQIDEIETSEVKIEDKKD